MIRPGFEVTDQLRKKINSLAKKVGCPLNWRVKPGFQWNGKYVACKGQDASNVIHDIAHFHIASENEREAPDFGLGPGPDSTESSKALYVYSICNNKESDASALGIFWERQMGLPWNDTAGYHSWETSDLERAWYRLNLKWEGK